MKRCYILEGLCCGPPFYWMVLCRQIELIMMMDASK